MKSAQRFIELDVLRVIAIALMIAYHAAYDLAEFAGKDFDVFSGGWHVVERTSATLFLLLVGLCFVLSWERTHSYKKYFLRGLRIFGYGMIVTVVTYFFDPETYVRFGVLHLIGLATMLLPLFVRLRYWNVPLGLGTLYLGFHTLNSVHVSTSLFLPIGLFPEHFRSVDYFPLIPWMGIILIGTALGAAYVRYRPATNTQPSTLRKAVTFISHHSLFIYMVHQPVLLFALFTH